MRKYGNGRLRFPRLGRKATIRRSAGLGDELERASKQHAELDPLAMAQWQMRKKPQEAQAILMRFTKTDPEKVIALLKERPSGWMHFANNLSREGILDKLFDELPEDQKQKVATVFVEQGCDYASDYQPTLRGEALRCLAENPVEPLDLVGITSTHVVKWAQQNPAAASQWPAACPPASDFCLRRVDFQRVEHWTARRGTPIPA